MYVQSVTTDFVHLTGQLVFDGKFGDDKSHPFCSSNSYQLDNGIQESQTGVCMFNVSGLVNMTSGDNITSGNLGRLPSEGCDCGGGDDLQQVVDVQFCGECRGK